MIDEKEKELIGMVDKDLVLNFQCEYEKLIEKLENEKFLFPKYKEIVLAKYLCEQYNKEAEDEAKVIFSEKGGK